MKKQILIPILVALTMGCTFTAQAMNTNGKQTDSYNTKPFFDKEKQINQGKNIIINQ